MIKRIAMAAGPGLCLLLNLINLEFINPQADLVISVAVWMIVWWVFEVVSISVTALIPILIYPLLGIKPFKEVTLLYGSPIVFLFMGGFFLALAMEKVNLHKRLALNIIKLCGTGEDRLLIGFILATAVLSMWISNTATTLVLMPIGLTVAEFLAKESMPSNTTSKFKVALMMAIAFAANIGGTATIIGTPPNVVLVGFLESELNQEVSFLQWTMTTLPFTVIMLIGCWIIIKWLIPFQNSKGQEHDIISKELNKLGKMSKGEWQVAICFGVTIMLWMFRIQFNELTNLKLTNGEIAMWGGMSSFLIPASVGGENQNWLLEWTDTQRMQWGILIMFGGGLALADGLSSSGIIQFIGDSLSASNLSATTMVIFMVIIMTGMTTVMSNVALVAVFSPILLGITGGMGIEFLDLGIPVALASSCAFMLPMSTPPNAIVYTSGVVKVQYMLKVGFVLNIISTCLLVLMGWLLTQ